MFAGIGGLQIAGLMAALFLPRGTVQSTEKPADLASAIERFQSGAAVVRTEDLDASACAPLRENPGIVTADLNGDGRQDSGVLLRLRYTGKETTWQGKVLREAQFAFVMFLDQGRGEFKSRVVHRYTDDVPSSVTIDLEPPGIVRHRGTGKEVRLPHPGIMMSFCEKSATIYYLVGNRLRSIPVSD